MIAIPAVVDPAAAVQAPAEGAGKTASPAEGSPSFADALSSAEKAGKSEGEDVSAGSADEQAKEADETEGASDSDGRIFCRQSPTVITGAQVMLIVQEAVAKTQSSQPAAGSLEDAGTHPVNTQGAKQGQQVAVGAVVPGEAGGKGSQQHSSINALEPAEGLNNRQMPSLTLKGDPTATAAIRQEAEQNRSDSDLQAGKPAPAGAGTETATVENSPAAGTDGRGAASQAGERRTGVTSSREDGVSSNRVEPEAAAQVEAHGGVAAASQPDTFKVEAGSHVNAKSAVVGAEQGSKGSGLDIVQQVVRQAEFFIKDGKTGLAIQLHPEHLGKVSLSVVSTDTGVALQVMAESRQTHELLQANLANLQNAFQERGVSLDRVLVQLGTHMDQSGFSAKGQPGWSNSSSSYAQAGQSGNRFGGSLLESVTPWLEDRLVDLRV